MSHLCAFFKKLPMQMEKIVFIIRLNAQFIKKVPSLPCEYAHVVVALPAARTA